MNAGQRAIRIMHVASGDLWAGAEAQVCQIVIALNRLPGIAAAAALLNEGELASRLRQAGVEVRVFPESAVDSWTIYRELTAFMRTWHPDVVHTHRQKENILGALAARAAHVPASVRTAHGAPEFNYRAWQLPNRALRRLDEWVARHLQQRVIAVSDELGAKLRQHFVGAEIVVVPNGIDVEAVRLAATPMAQLEPGFHHIAFVGRLVPVKRVDVFLQAAAQLACSFPGKYRFHLIGDGPLRLDIEQMASDIGIAGDCVLHGFQPEAPRWIAAMDCVVLTSDHEGLPMTALEARALGIPLVAHSVGGLVALLENDDDCRLVPTQSPAAIAACIRDVTESGHSSARTSALKELYGIDATAQSHALLYAAMLPAHHQQLAAVQ